MSYIPIFDVPLLIEELSDISPDSLFLDSSYNSGIYELVKVLSAWRKEFPFVDVYLSGSLERTTYERTNQPNSYMFGLRRVGMDMEFEHAKVLAVETSSDMLLIDQNTLNEYPQNWGRKNKAMEWMHCASHRLRKKGESNDCIWLSAGDTINFVGIRSDAKVDMKKVREFVRRYQSKSPMFLQTI